MFRPLFFIVSHRLFQTRVFGFIPPSQFGKSNPLGYAVLILAGILVIGIAPPLLMHWFHKPGWKAAGDTSASAP